MPYCPNCSVRLYESELSSKCSECGARFDGDGWKPTEEPSENPVPSRTRDEFGKLLPKTSVPAVSQPATPLSSTADLASRITLALLFLILALGWGSAYAMLGYMAGGNQYIAHVGAGFPAAMNMAMSGLSLFAFFGLLLFGSYPKLVSIPFFVGTLLHFFSGFAFGLIPANTQFLGMPSGNESRLFLPGGSLIVHLIAVYAYLPVSRRMAAAATLESAQPIRLKVVIAAACSLSIALAGFLAWRFLGDPERERTWRLETWAQCKRELQSIPETVQVAGIADEGAALRKTMISDLFSSRGLAFIEVRVNRKFSRVAYPDGSQEDGWRLPGIQSSWVRIELANSKSPKCVAAPYGLDYRINRPPFLPDTCLAITPIDQPSSRYVLKFSPAKVDQIFREAGSWSLVDQKSGQTLAKLPTVDTEDSISASGLSKSFKKVHADCRSPHSVLVNLLWGDGGQGEQLLSQATVTATPDIRKLQERTAEFGEVLPDVQEVYWTKDEHRLLFGAGIHQEAWEAAVDQARREGLSNYGRKLLHWDSRRLVDLRISSDQNSYPWQAFAVDRGFIVVSTSPSWTKKAGNLMAFYAADGSFLWARRVNPPSRSNQFCPEFYPQAVYVTDTHLALVKQCEKLSHSEERKTGKDTRGEIWLIPLKGLGRLRG